MMWKPVLVLGAIDFVEVAASLGDLVSDEQLFQGSLPGHSGWHLCVFGSLLGYLHATFWSSWVVHLFACSGCLCVQVHTYIHAQRLEVSLECCPSSGAVHLIFGGRISH